MTRRTDALEAAQVEGWWAGVEQLDIRVASVYLRALVLTGACREVQFDDKPEPGKPRVVTSH